MSVNAKKRILIAMGNAKQENSRPKELFSVQELTGLVNQQFGRRYTETCVVLYLRQLILDGSVENKAYGDDPGYRLTGPGLVCSAELWKECERNPQALNYQPKNIQEPTDELYRLNAPHPARTHHPANPALTSARYS